MGNSNQKPKFKCCLIELDSNCNDWGFILTLNLKPKYAIHTINPESAAYSANLRVEDVIIKIDGAYVRRSNFDKVKYLLNNAFYKRHYVEILAVNINDYKWFKKRRRFISIDKIITDKNTLFYSNKHLKLSHALKNNSLHSISNLSNEGKKKIHSTKS